IADRLTRWRGRPASPEAVVAFVGVEAAYLDEAFAEIDRRSGSLDARFTDALGIDAATRDRIAERLPAGPRPALSRRSRPAATNPGPPCCCRTARRARGGRSCFGSPRGR